MFHLRSHIFSFLFADICFSSQWEDKGNMGRGQLAGKMVSVIKRREHLRGRSFHHYPFHRPSCCDIQGSSNCPTSVRGPSWGQRPARRGWWGRKAGASSLALWMPLSTLQCEEIRLSLLTKPLFGGFSNTQSSTHSLRTDLGIIFILSVTQQTLIEGLFRGEGGSGGGVRLYWRN